MSYSLLTDAATFQDIPGYKNILRVVLKTQIQHLVN